MSRAYVYIMRYENNIIKVGQTIDVRWRRKDLKNARERLDIMRVWKMDYYFSRHVEKRAHDTLRPYLAYGYESYKTSLRKAVEAVENAIDHMKCHGYARFRVKEIGISKCRKSLVNGESCRIEFWASRGVAI